MGHASALRTPRHTLFNKIGRTRAGAARCGSLAGRVRATVGAIILLLGLAIGLVIGVSAWFGSLLVGLGYLGVKVLKMTDDE
jgi:hypothetical protein